MKKTLNKKTDGIKIYDKKFLNHISEMMLTFMKTGNIRYSIAMKKIYGKEELTVDNVSFLIHFVSAAVANDGSFYTEIYKNCLSNGKSPEEAKKIVVMEIEKFIYLYGELYKYFTWSRKNDGTIHNIAYKNNKEVA